MKNLFIAALLVFSTWAQADIQQSAQARHYSPSQCGYYSRTATDVSLSLSAFDFPRYSVVTMIWGAEIKDLSNNKVYTWEGVRETKPYRLSGDNSLWIYDLKDLTYTSRGSSMQLNAINYLFRVEHLDGKVEWVKGNDSRLGYYRLDLSKLSFQCKKEESPWVKLQPESIRKD